MGIQKQLTQFQIKNFEDWYAIHPIPSKPVDEETSEELLNRNPYIPLSGEICGIIFQNDDELSNACPVIPDAYEKQERPFVILKMGNGKDDLWRLPWTNLINKDIVRELVDQLFTSKDDQSSGFVEVINSLFKTTTADWSQNNPEEYNYIKNKICSAQYSPINNPITILNNPQFLLSETSIQVNNKNLWFGDLDAGESISITNNFSELQNMDKYEVSLMNYQTKEVEKFQTSLFLLGSVNNSTYWGLGNTELFNKIYPEYQENLYKLTLEPTDDPFGIIFISSIDFDTSKQEIYTMFYCNSQYVLTNYLEQISSANITITHTEKCEHIIPISAKWLPSSIKASSDWLVQNPGSPGYIKNKICSILGYENNNITYLSNEQLILSEGNFGMLQGAIKQPIKDFGTINSYNKYKLNFDEEELEGIQFLRIQDLNGNPVYLLGNPYLYVKWLYDFCLALGGMEDFVLGLMNSIEDNGSNICLLCNSVENDLAVEVLYRLSEEYYQNAINILTSYKIETIGKITGENIVTFENIDLINQIQQETQKIDKYFIDETKKYYLQFEDQPDKFYLINNYSYNTETGHTYITLNNSPNIPLNTVVSATLFKENAFHTLTFQKLSRPSKIQTIDQMWLPEEIKVGRYNNQTGLEISAEIFNDYNQNQATGSYSHAEGYNTKAQGNYQHVQGKYNIPDETSAFIIGNGENTRSNAYKIDWNGNSEQSGSVSATEVKAGQHLLTQKENYSNKVNIISTENNEENYPTSNAVINYINELLNISTDQQNNIILEFTSIDGNGIYK